MAITSLRDGTVTFEGCVLGTHTQEERIMSDVYANVRYAIVWGGTSRGPFTVRVGDSEFGDTHSVIADAPHEVRVLYAAHLVTEEARKMVAEAAQLHLQQEDEAFEQVMRVTPGAIVAVVKGRKLPKGMGKVLRTANGGVRALVEMDGSGLSEWTDTDNLNRTDRTPPSGMSWAHYADSLREAQTASRGDLVTLPDGSTGLLFWIKDDRVGVSPSGIKNPVTGKYEDAVWTFASQITKWVAP